ncbi:chaplin [Streptomyces sp. 4N509B]|uniref:chaplin n=1 Tax=Streptomyces sp. 4N509B TaxID=3457413 RepID=UPI003FD1A805
MNNLKKAAAITLMTGGIVVAGAGVAAAHATAPGQALHSPGVGSGNVVQAPVHLPVNVNGNSVNVVGVLNPAFGNTSVNN